MTRQLTDRPAATAATAVAPARRRGRWSARTRRDFIVFLALALPNLALIAVFTYLPLINNIYYSTLDWTLGSASATVVGFDNYINFFTSADAPNVLGTTAIFTVVTVGGSMILGLLVALALNSKVRGTTFARSAVFAPYVLSGVGVGLVWLFIFDRATASCPGCCAASASRAPSGSTTRSFRWSW